MEDESFLRSTISPRESKTQTNIYLMYDGSNSVWASEPKAKVQLRNAETFTILLEQNVRPTNIEQYNKLETKNKTIVDNAIKYIKANKDIILKYWNSEFEEYELHNILKNKEQIQWN